jgi:hypothetical protein
MRNCASLLQTTYSVRLSPPVSRHHISRLLTPISAARRAVTHVSPLMTHYMHLQGGMGKCDGCAFPHPMALCSNV